VGNAEVEIERYLSSPPQRPAPKDEQRRAIIVLKFKTEAESCPQWESDGGSGVVEECRVECVQQP
jgi:hypothetical protein